MKKAIIREILKKDNLEIAKIMRDVLIELGVPKTGTAYADPELDCMYETYLSKRSAFFVVEEDNMVIGGAGISPLRGGEPTTCELQKMYFSVAARGRGLGDQMIDHCLDYAKTQGFELCYLETLPYMKAAQKLYRKKGFQYIDKPMGATGHTSCNVWLTKKIQ